MARPGASGVILVPAEGARAGAGSTEFIGSYRIMAKLKALVQPMADLITTPSAGPRSLRLDTLVGLRWLALVGQTAAVLVVNLGLGFPLPLAACLGLIALSALVNV